MTISFVKFLSAGMHPFSSPNFLLDLLVYSFAPSRTHRFPREATRDRHVRGVHLKTKEYVCQYAGCTAAYDDCGSRSNHERMQHGMPYVK